MMDSRSGPDASMNSPIRLPGPGYAASARWPRRLTEAPGKAKPGDRGVVEAGHRPDAVASESQDDHPVDVKYAGCLVAQVDAERGLPVGPGGDQPERPAREDHRLKEAPGHRRPHVLTTSQRRGDDDIVGKQRDQGVDVARLIRRGELPH